MRLKQLIVCCFLLCYQAIAQSNLPPALDSEIKKIRVWAAEEVIVQAVQNQNKEGLTLERIKQIDKEWIAATEETALMKSLLTRECSRKLRSLAQGHVAVIEAFVMDSQGANVCMTQRTSDYWQGDEPKWTDSFNQGNGAEIVGQRQYDSSSKATLVHVSLPVMEGGKAIGVLTCGINLSKLAEVAAQP